MADVKAEKLGEYQELFFKLQGTNKSESEFMALTDPVKIEQVKNIYNAWVEKYVNIGENTPEDKKQEAAEKSYFDKCEEEIANMDKNHPDYFANYTKATKKLDEAYEKAGWKSMEVGIVLPDGTKTLVDVHYNPESSDYKGLSADELQRKLSEEYLEKHPVEQSGANEEEPKENEENKPKEDEAEPLSVTENESENVPAEENQDWKDDKEKFWKEHCAGYEQECTRDPEDKEGLSLDITKGDKKLGRVRYADKKHASISSEDGKPADYSVFLGLVKDAKRNNQAINFSGQMSPEFAAKLKLACEEMGVAYQNAPEGKIDANSFSDQLSDEAKKKLEEYNTAYDLAHPQDNNKEDENVDKPKEDENNKEEPNEDNSEKSFESYTEKFEKDLAEGKEIDISSLLADDKTVAYAAALVIASKEENKDKNIQINGAPKEVVDYTGGVVTEDEDGKKTFSTRDMPEELKNLPKEGRAALQGHNNGIRSEQIAAARAKMTPEEIKAHDEKEAKRAEKRAQPNMSRNEIFERFKNSEGR